MIYPKRPKTVNGRKWKGYKAKIDLLREMEKHDDFVHVETLDLPRLTGQQRSQILGILKKMGFVEMTVTDKGRHTKAWRLNK